MNLVLQGTALNDEPMSQPLVGRFDERGGTLGRSDGATFTLPDPERMISRVQAQVLHVDDCYWIENVSAASSILHNGRSLSAGMRISLRAGDELKVGGYTLLVAMENDETSATILRGRTVITHLAPDAVRKGAAAEELPAAPIPAGSGPAAAPMGAQPAPGIDTLWRSFLAGAGVELSSPPTPDQMAAIGAMMRIAVDGIHRLVGMRAVAKDEMQAHLTMIQVRGNNPLKFAPDAAVALRMLLQPPARGFLDGPAALRAALIDLQSHEVGMMAGMRAALEAVLERFVPEKLEAQLTKKSVFDALRPAHRRARLWELYLEHYRSLRDEAQQDFQRLFGEAFRAAYEAQVRSLEAGAPAGPRAGGGMR
jgi:predicted component of type VI protein secretion system